MAHQYNDNSPKTGFELKYEKELSQVHEEFDQKKLQYNTVPRNEIIKTPDIMEYMEKNQPNKAFVKAYNERVIEETLIQQREILKDKYDRNGNLLSFFWEDEQFKKIHDPLNIYKKKGNYKDLAWKVFRNVDDDDIFLKVFYYPELTQSDYTSLINLYNDHNKRYLFHKRMTYLSVFGASIVGWGVAYTKRFKFAGFLGTTIGTFLVSKFLLDRMNFNSLKSNLNKCAVKFAETYPEVKFSKVENVRGSEVNVVNH